MSFFGSMIPLTGFLLIGYILKKIGLINDDVKKFINKYLFYIAMPALAFRSIAAFNFKESYAPKMILHNISITTLAFVVGIFLALLIKENKKRGAFHMALYRSNQGYVGLHVVNTTYGQLALSKAAVNNGFDNPLVNVFSIISMELFRSNKKKDDLFVKTGKVILNVLKNPFVVAIILGMLESHFNTGILKITPIDSLLEMMGRTALPLALISIGCSLVFTYIKENLMLVLSVSLARLVVLPLIGYFLGIYLFNLNALDLSVSVTLLSTPIAISSYVFAKEMGGDEHFMASCIGMSTILSVITMPIVNIILKI